MRFSRIRRAIVTLVCVGALSLSATACAPSEAEPTPTPTKTAIFASEDEALQAAVDVYQQYNAAYSSITSSGTVDYDSLKTLVTDDYFSEISADTYFQDNNQHTEGTSSFQAASLVSLSQSASTASVRLKLCQDVSKVRIVDSSGSDVTPLDRTDIFPWEVALVWDDANDQLKIEDEGSWQGDNFCKKQP